MTESEFAAPVADLTEGRWARFLGLLDRGFVLTIIPPPSPAPRSQTSGGPQCWPWSHVT